MLVPTIVENDTIRKGKGIMKKTLCVLLALITTIAFTSFVSASTSNPSEEQLINTGVSLETPKPDPHNDLINAQKMAELNASMIAARKAGNKSAETAFVLCATRPQITMYWCGLAAAEQVIRAYGNSNCLFPTYGTVQYNIAGTIYISGSYNQITINKWLYESGNGSVGTSGASMGQVTNAINHFSTDSFNWSHIHVSGTGTTCANNVFSLYRVTIGTHQKCGVVSVYTQFLDYYNGTNCIHYISVNGYTSESSTVVEKFNVVDPHYNTAYRGAHEVQALGFGKAVAGTLDNVIW
jgi:hypothetical protein